MAVVHRHRKISTEKERNQYREREKSVQRKREISTEKDFQTFRTTRIASG